MYNELGLFEVNLDMYKIIIVAKSKEQAESHCFNMFDFSNIETKYLGETDEYFNVYPVILNIWTR